MDRCLYEVLGVSQWSSPGEIRSTYLRQALKLHPDKVAATNGGVATPAATAVFQELLHAYMILSDPVKRQYYDACHPPKCTDKPQSPESTSTATAKPPPRSPFPFFKIDILSYFNDSAFSGFTDSGHGFYKVYGDLFPKLHAFELRSGATSPAPKLGNLDSPDSQVEAFYKYWLSFSTVLNVGGKSTSNPKLYSELEEKNKKAKNEHNHLVRSLAAFVRIRDKRVIDMEEKKKPEVEKGHNKNAQRREERKRMSDIQAKKKLEEEKRREEKARREEEEWMRFTKLHYGV